MKAKQHKPAKKALPHDAKTHLISKIGKVVKREEPKPEEIVAECKYGIYCAHLRSEGKCPLPHRRSHFHFLNLVASPNCLEDEEKEEQALSKR